MRQARVNSGHEMSGRIMSDDFDGLDATEKAAIEAALNRCCALAAQIARELRNKRSEHFVDKLSLADFYASLERAAWVLEQKTASDSEGKPPLPSAGAYRFAPDPISKNKIKNLN
jgi:hypothetical protein